MNRALLFAEHCRKNYNEKIISYETVYKYNSLSMCILDCIYSLRAQYYTITIPVLKRYAQKYMNNDIYGKDDSLSNFIYNIEQYETCEQFAIEVLNNKQKLSGRNKAEVCLEIAKKLKDLLDIEYYDDFKNFEKEELLEIVLRSVKGMGDAGINYLFMLAGNPNKCKPDVHIHHCIRDALGVDVSNEECQNIFSEAIVLLNKDYPKLTIRDLDNIIWNEYQSF